MQFGSVGEDNGILGETLDLTVRQLDRAVGDQIGCANVRAQVVKLGTTRTGADSYLEVTFTTGSLAPGASTGEIQLRVAKSDWSVFNQADDHSYRTSSSLTDFDRVTAYSGGTLSWGAEP